MANTEKDRLINIKDLAGIQYSGIAGATQSCLEAIVRLIHHGVRIKRAKLLTSKDKYHAFILDIENEDAIAIKSGFASGYGGTGSKGLSIALQILCKHGIDIEEFEVTDEFIERLNLSCLLRKDMQELESESHLRPSRYYDYIYDNSPAPTYGSEPYNSQVVKNEFPAVIPFHIIDDRLLEFALTFSDNADTALKGGFRRLETIVSERANIHDEVGGRLFSSAFLGDEAPLTWQLTHKGENAARVQMFTGTFGAYRNPRMHKEREMTSGENLREFLLLNELYHLEASAIEARETSKKEPVPVAPSC